VPAAAVIPAPIAYIKVVAVKKLVVEPWAWLAGPLYGEYWTQPSLSFWLTIRPCGVWRTRTFTLKKLECSKQAFARIY
jgi:hypothetical protein